MNKGNNTIESMQLSHFVTDKNVFCHAKILLSRFVSLGSLLGILSSGHIASYDAAKQITAEVTELSFLLSWSEEYTIQILLNGKENHSVQHII